MRKQYKFQHVKNDMWNNPIVKCPVCLTNMKQDGAMKHIVRKSQEGDSPHAEWYTEWRKTFTK